MINTAREQLTGPASGYSQPLRVIGFALEVIEVDAFKITYDAPNFVVKLGSRKRSELPLRRTRKSTVCQVFHPMYPSGRSNSSSDVELIYTPEHLERLDNEGLLRRRGSGELDPNSLAQSLRALGAYLECKGARLIRISKHGPFTSIEYDSSQDGRTREQFMPSALYALFVRMYVKSSDPRRETYKQDLMAID
jgi:hypothetical protein